MACIYNEKVKRSMKPLVLLLALLGVSLMLVSYFGKSLGLSSDMEMAIDLVLTLVFLFAGYNVYSMSSEVYRYSIIADDFLIHKISGGNNKLLEKMKLYDIKALEATKNRREVLRNLKNNYSGNLTKPGYYCEYRSNGKNRTFRFDPSACMINKINNSRLHY